MSRLILLGLMAFVFGISNTSAQAEWTPFESSPHKFRIDYPGPVRESKGAMPADIGGNYYDIQSMIVPLRQTFGVRVVDDPYAHKNPTDAQLKVRLDRARESAVSDGLDDGKLIKEIDVRLNGLLGREIHIENEKYLAIMRIHYFHKRMYLVTAVMTKSKSDPKDFSDQAMHFLTSFEILK